MYGKKQMSITSRFMIKACSAAVVAGGLLLGSNIAVAAGKLTISGSTTVDNTIMTPYRADIEGKSGLALDVVGNGSGRGVADLEAGKADVAMISSPLDAVISKANKSKPGSLSGAGLQAHPVGGTKMFVVVNKNNPVNDLTPDQARDIFTGKITNWKDVGGPDLGIQVFSERASGGARSTFEKDFLKGELLASAKPVGSVALGVKIAGQNPKAITFAGRKLMTSDVKSMPSVVIEQPLWLVTKGDPSPEAAALIAATAEIGNNL